MCKPQISFTRRKYTICHALRKWLHPNFDVELRGEGGETGKNCDICIHCCTAGFDTPTSSSGAVVVGCTETIEPSCDQGVGGDGHRGEYDDWRWKGDSDGDSEASGY